MHDTGFVNGYDNFVDITYWLEVLSKIWRPLLGSFIELHSLKCLALSLS